MIYHSPVLLKESIGYLHLKKDGIYVDATLGGGGHSEAILKNSLISHVYAFDQDKDAIEYASTKLNKYKNKLTIIKANFAQMRTKLALNKVSQVDGVLLDLGVSSHQIDTADRGFSFQKEGLLDMRMDRDKKTTAGELLNSLSVGELTKIFREFGEENAAHQIAIWIDSARKQKAILTTEELGDVIEKRMRGNPIHITKTKARVFQALRIYLNSELKALEVALEDAINILASEGRLVVISYHSLEDRIIKQKFNNAARGCICPTSILKCMCNKKPKVKLVTKKFVEPSEEEIKINSRARSAKMRAVEKLSGGSK